MVIVTNDRIPPVQDDTILVVEPSVKQPPEIGRLRIGHYYPSRDRFGLPVWKTLDQEIPKFVNTDESFGNIWWIKPGEKINVEEVRENVISELLLEGKIELEGKLTFV